MATVRTHRYAVEAGNLAAMLERRTSLIDGIRSANPAFAEATLITLEDGSYLDIWRWNSAAEMQRALQNAASSPLARETLRLTTDHTVLDGELLDER